MVVFRLLAFRCLVSGLSLDYRYFTASSFYTPIGYYQLRLVFSLDNNSSVRWTSKSKLGAGDSLRTVITLCIRLSDIELQLKYGFR